MRMAAFGLGLLMLGAFPAQAHKVIASVFMAGGMIEGEIGFSNGEVADNRSVLVFDGDGNQVGETVTDGDGFFVFEPVGEVTHVFRANLGAGHVAEAVMAAEEFSGGVAAPPTASKGAGTGSLSPQVRGEIAEMIRDELRPLRREIAAYKEKNDLQNILGGIGYIFGVFGVAFYIMARRQTGQGVKT